MIIKSVELENIRSYKSGRVEFERGINFLSGDIGSGKSSILHAIEFGLFGFKRGDLEGFQLLRKGESKGSIKVVLESDDGLLVEIGRIIKRSGSDNISQGNGFVSAGGNLIELSPTELNDYVFGLLNFPKEFLSKDKNLIFRFTIYTPQEQLKEILFASADSRLEVIRKIFGIDKYKLLCDAVAIYNPRIREKKKVLISKIEELPKLKEEVEEAKKKVLEVDKDLKIFEKKEIEYDEKLKKNRILLDKRNVVYEKINSQMFESEKRIAVINEAKKSIENIERDLKERRELVLKIEKSDYEKKIADAKKGVLELEKSLIVLDKEKDEIDVLLKEEDGVRMRKEELREQMLKVDGLKKRYEDLKKGFDYVLTLCQIKDLEAEISKYLVFAKKFESLDKEADKLSKRKIVLEEKIKVLSEQVVVFDKKVLGIDSIKVCDNCMQEVDAKHKKEIVRTIKSDKKGVEVELRDAEKELKMVSKDLSKILSQRDISSDAKEKVDLMKNKLDLIKEREIRERESNDELNKIDVQIVKLEKVDFEKEFKIIDKRIEEFEKLEKRIREIEQKKKKISDEVYEKNMKILKTQNFLDKKIEYEKEIERLLEDRKKRLAEVKGRDVLLEEIEKKKLEFDKVKLEKKKLEGNVDILYETLRKLSSKISSFKTEIKSLSEQIKKSEDKISKVGDEKKLLSELVDMESFLNKDVVRACNLIEKSLFTKYFVEFNEEFEKLFRELIEDNEIDVRLDAEFSPVIEQNGFDVDVKNLSGGEKSSLAVAYRLGLKRIIESSFSRDSHLSLLILDEPTDGFSNEQVIRLGNILKGSRLDQIILVSHDEKVEGIADNVLSVEKVNHVSCVSSLR